MKIRCAAAAALTVFISASLFSSCGTAADTETVSDKSSVYYELEKSPEVSVNEALITVVLAEDQALPYRWEVLESSGNVSVKSDLTVDKPVKGSMNAGSSPAFRVMVFAVSDNEDAHIHLYSKWVNSDDISDANGERDYYFVYKDGAFVRE